ncbi:MAG: methyltransferase domain-containing protein [Proteobacteria bacterium]|jgi:predicted methyltransferase|nr:methyltransferase domain-containing protein [Pseudomonadota bacterium]MDA0927918.1 methyltransferase domain-containing protein [Pseudomonadota bacterium]
MTKRVSKTSCAALVSLMALIASCEGMAQDSAALRRALAGPDREVTDFVRDEVRKPVEVLEFLGIGTGMTVLDVYAAGGYYTYILSKAVGPDGLVYAQNTERGLAFREDRQEISQGEALANKIRQGNLSNVRSLVGRVADLDIPAASLDGILLMQTLHDSYNGSPTRSLNLLLELKRFLKPGGVIGITDHVGIAANDNRELHRMQIEQAIDVSERAGFIVQSSDILRNPRDDHSRSIFDPRLARNTDRFLLRLINPD